MANLTPTPAWDEVFQLETDTPVLGGAGGVANSQAQALLNRFGFLEGDTGSSKVGHTPAGTGAVVRTVEGKLRDWVDVRDFGASPGGDISAAIALALAAGHKRIRAYGSYSVNSLITVSQNSVLLDLRQAELTAASALNNSLIRLTGNRSVVMPGLIDGFASGQTASSFGIDLNGGSHNKVLGGRVTNCKTYGIYNIGCSYALIKGVEVDNCQQSGIAGDVGAASVVGFRVKNVIVRDNGLGGVGATSGLYLEGTPATNHWFSELDIDDIIAYGNRGAGVAGQGWQYYTLQNIKSRANHQQGIALFACLYGNGGEFILNGNNVGALSGYDNGLSIDDTGVTPPSEYNTFSNIFSKNHPGFAVLERGTANNNTFVGVDSIADGGVFSFVGANTFGVRRNVTQGNRFFANKLLGNSSLSGVGYGVGAGGSVVQATSKSTGVTLNALSGRITMNNAALSAGALVEFVLTNSAIASTDHLMFNVVSGATQAAYIINARPANGQATIEIRNNTGGALSEAIVISFVIIKGSVS